MALAFASLISVLTLSPALAAERDGRDQGGRNGQQDQHASRDRHARNEHRHEPRQSYRYEQNRYEQPVYVPPPVYYDEPQRSPGISIFFPFDLRR